MTKRNKRKSTSRRPALSLIDKAVYFLLITISLIGPFLAIYLWEDLRDAIAFRDPSVIAYHYHISAYLGVLLLGYIELSGLVFFGERLSYKKPIIGSIIDPKRKTVKEEPWEKRMRKKLLFAWCIGLLIALITFMLSLFGRDCLRRDNSIVSYSMVNRQMMTVYSENDYSGLVLYTTYVSRGNYWKVGMTIEMSDGKFFSFTNRSFDHRDDGFMDICLEKMLEVRALFPTERITINGEENVDKAADYFGLNEEQRQRLYSLFSCSDKGTVLLP